MTEQGKYVYCIINKNKSQGENFFLQDKDQNFSLIGIDGKEVSLIDFKDITAIVSDTPVINFDRLNKTALTKHLTVHQQVNEEIMKDYDVVPMAFGIIAPSDDEVKRILAKAYLQFKTALNKIKDKIEFAIQAWWDEKKLLEELANNNPEIRQLKQEVSLRGGVFALPAKLKLGKFIQQQLEAYKKNCIKDIQRFFKGFVDDSTQVADRLIDDEMIINFSCLIKRVDEPEFDKRINQLGSKYEGKLRFKYIGPMPPYSFININLSLGNFELVNGARELLELGEEATFEQIKKAYRTFAHQYHPDKHSDQEEQMKEINVAYSILESYCQSCDSLIGRNEGQKYFFQEEDVKNSLIIRK